MNKKTLVYIVPAALVVGSGCWLINSTLEVKDLQTEVEQADRILSMADSTGVARPSSALVRDSASSFAPVFTTNNRINWSALAALLNAYEAGNRSSHIKEMIESATARMETMSVAEMDEALEEIKLLMLDQGMSRKEKEALGDWYENIADARKDAIVSDDPQGVLAKYGDKIGGEGRDGSIARSALEAWAAKDPLAAMHWLDKKIEEGVLSKQLEEGFGEARKGLETTLLEYLLAAGYHQQAKDRIQEIPEDERLDILKYTPYDSFDKASLQAHADMIRANFSEAQRLEVFGYITQDLASNYGYKSVQNYLKVVNASPEERITAAQQAATGTMGAIGSPNLADIEAMRKWLQIQAPDEVDRITGEALLVTLDRNMGGQLSYETASKLLLEFHTRTGSDDLLIGFVNGASKYGNREDQMRLVEMVKDPVKKQQLLQDLK